MANLLHDLGAQNWQSYDLEARVSLALSRLIVPRHAIVRQSVPETAGHQSEKSENHERTKL